MIDAVGIDGSQRRSTVIRFSVRCRSCRCRSPSSRQGLDRGKALDDGVPLRHAPHAAASAMVATMGRPSGIAATASAMPASIMSITGLPVMTPAPAMLR